MNERGYTPSDALDQPCKQDRVDKFAELERETSVRDRLIVEASRAETPTDLARIKEQSMLHIRTGEFRAEVNQAIVHRFETNILGDAVLRLLYVQENNS